MFVASAYAYPTPSIFLLPVPATGKRLQTAVSAQLRPRTTTTTTTGKDDDEEFNQHNVGSIGHAVFTASSSKPVNQSPVRKESQQLLSGSDVLRALSKAAAEKTKAKHKNQKGTQTQTASTTTTTGAAKIIKGTKTVPDVPPLQVKEEWGVRLEHLQNRLDELNLETI